MPELLDRQACVASDAAHRESVNRIVARNGYYALPKLYGYVDFSYVRASELLVNYG
jgi:hypothetical protein